MRNKLSLLFKNGSIDDLLLCDILLKFFINLRIYISTFHHFQSQSATSPLLFDQQSVSSSNPIKFDRSKSYLFVSFIYLLSLKLLSPFSLSGFVNRDLKIIISLSSHSTLYSSKSINLSDTY